MLIKVKVLDDNGQAKGRGYTYKSDIDVSIGELVIADMAGKDKILVVTETDVDESEIKNVDFGIKTIKGLAVEADIEEIKENATIDFKVVKEVLPVIKINFEELKQALNETLEEYSGIVVTEQSLSTCKAKQKELASVRVKIDSYRKDKKKELSKPITAFENQCKELISLIEQVEQPIKQGIASFDNLKKDEKRNTALRLIKEVAEEQELNEKYATRLEVLDKYCNLTAKEKDVKEDLIARAMTLKVEQDREEELIDIIKGVIDSENERINRKMRFEDFKRYIDMGMSAKDVIAEIKLSASKIYEAENPPMPEPIPESIFEPIISTSIPDPTIAPVQETVSEPLKPIEPAHEDTYYAVYRIVGRAEELKSVSQFLKQNNIQYTVIEQDEL